ncbi:MAG: alanine dehydrogenase, partial [Thermus sp.]
GLEALLEDGALLKGLNTHKGLLTHPGVAEAFGLPYTPPEEALRR